MESLLDPENANKPKRFKIKDCPDHPANPNHPDHDPEVIY